MWKHLMPSVHHDGDGSRNVLPFGNLGIPHQEPALGEEEICSAVGRDKQHLHSSIGQGAEERKSVCELDRLRSMWQPPDIHLKGSDHVKSCKSCGIQGSFTTSHNSLADTAFDMGATEHQGIPGSSRLRHTLEGGGKSKFISRATSPHEAIRELHAESDAGTHSTTRSIGQQHGSGGNCTSRASPGTESDAVTAATDSSDVPGGCKHEPGGEPTTDSGAIANSSSGASHSNGHLGAMGADDRAGGGESKSVGLSRWPTWMIASTGEAQSGGLSFGSVSDSRNESRKVSQV